ncbi:MAG: bifunctional DNA-formamidopyrimidine glycosylase/DNA-(apurinic or apyrimidinic site) lyase [Lachnospiraceae bacterium]|nr:bifunctional DNA-formamidopyrimidine glycosylase/DNA-(apurinic or apyrimidinic site) lyase [Lachnospiraceae bacterium]
MPELPEVETVRRVLEPQIRGLVIKNAVVNRPEVVAYPDADAFIAALRNQVVAGIDRRGKFLSILLESGDGVIVHFRMTGCLLFTPPVFEMEKHTHIILQMENEWQLRFVDTRRFGRFWYLKADEMHKESGEDTVTGIGNLGKEPFDSDFNSRYLIDRLEKRRIPIKECLLDQKVIAGIGNIYSDEILFASGIDPRKPANELTDEEWNSLACEIPEQLTYFIEKNVISPEEYLAGKGKDYRNTPYLRVYGRSGKPCTKCGETLCKCVIGGRSSVYCPNCQRGREC